MDYMTRQENYIDRKKVFKNIWDTAMEMDGANDLDFLNKPKAIKSLRLDEVDRCVVPKRKKQRIKNLRMVCKKILSFCDKQESEDCYYEQFATFSRLPTTGLAVTKPEEPPNQKKVKTVRKKRKITRAKSAFTPGNEPLQKKSTITTRRNITPAKTKNRESILRNSSVFKSTIAPVKPPINIETTLFGDSANRRRKIGKNSSLKSTK